MFQLCDLRIAISSLMFSDKYCESACALVYQNGMASDILVLYCNPVFHLAMSVSVIDLGWRKKLIYLHTVTHLLAFVGM